MADIRSIDLDDGTVTGALVYLTTEEMAAIVRLTAKLSPSPRVTSDLYDEFDSLFNRFYEHGVHEVDTDFHPTVERIEWKAGHDAR